MPDELTQNHTTDDPLDSLRARTDSLEVSFNELRRQSDERLIRAEVKATAIRSGIIDLDCLQFLDLSTIQLNDKGEVMDAAPAVAKLKKDKPWLFTTSSSSSFNVAPSAQVSRQKHAMEMTDSEYSAARIAVLRHCY
jgi:hypothetical protein